MDQRITGVVESAVTELVRRFTDEPARFFTESDLVCTFYGILQTGLSRLDLETARDRDGHVHQLVHCEYPTPFRCDMAGLKFELKGDDDPTPKGGRFRRGFCDIVVFNPDFISAFSYPELKAQNFELYKKAVVPSLVAGNHSLLHGVEFVFKRDVPRGKKQEEWATRLVAEVLQDADKLQACLGVTGFMATGMTLVFVKGTKSALREVLQARLSSRADVNLHFTD